ncbi:hypothetical protein [cf. Phormidesmis sp. LEGE 11477]|uniref:hypothetical protein n=1 Tax=cf. Phormidesmis sp. LEGE 11477 TaxID=1828680 RepID=UPI00187F410C|nr:hypothetical protein [cf. Phormidesmis sp. LEGE 11477]MBE9062476.1 hypothetical protein [cf. Phormidesmis sp. LEGE 11477]
MIDTTLFVNQSNCDQTVYLPVSSPQRCDQRAGQQLQNYPEFSWELVVDASEGLPLLVEVPTISRPSVATRSCQPEPFPYGDRPALLAKIRKTTQPKVIRDAYALSALRFKLNPFQAEDSREDNKVKGIPTVLQALYWQKKLQGKLLEHDADSTQWLEMPSLQSLEAAVNERQEKMRSLYTRELVPLMNANPLDPTLHCHGLSSQLVHDLKRYVQLQNSPNLFFDLMQWLERDIAVRRWRSARLGQPLSSEDALTFVMNSWIDPGGQRRKKAITCPTRVPLGYMQSIRRKNQPFITQEFADHAHGAFNHWLQEHIWQRFYSLYSEQCQLSPAQFFKQIGRSHFAFADAIYELHMANVANPANTNFWTVLQFYLPLMAPWS